MNSCVPLYPMRCFVFFIWFGLPLVSISQQPWTRPFGEIYLQAGTNTFFYRNIYGTPISFQSSPRTIRQIIPAFYSEVGLTKRVMFTGNFPFVVVSNGPADTSHTYIPYQGFMTALGNVNVGLTIQLMKKGGFILSAAGFANLRSASRDNGLALQSGYQAYGFEPQMLGGWGWKKHFLSLGLAGNFRSHNYSHQIIFKGQWGSRIGKKQRGWFILGWNYTAPLNKKTDAENLLIDGNSFYTGMYRNEASYIGIDMKWGIELGDWSGWFTLSGGPGWKVGMAPVLGLAVARKLQLTESSETSSEKVD